MMTESNTKTMQRKAEYEEGKITFENLTSEEIKLFAKLYIKEINENKKEIKRMRIKIRELKECS